MQRWAVFLITIVFGCGAASAQTPADVEFFESKVRPVLVERCHSCHSTNAKKMTGKLLLASRAAILKGGESGPAAVPGEPAKSLLIEAIHYGREDLQMPRSGKLPAREIAVLEEWVRRGVPYPGPVVAIANKDGIDWAKGRTFWSFQTPKMTPPPQVRDKAWPQRPIDAFVLAELEKRGLAPTKPADPRVLIRRVYFDLVGLPPTPEDVAAFVRDWNSPLTTHQIDRSAACVAAVWRTLGSLLARLGSLLRHRRSVGRGEGAAVALPGLGGASVQR